MGGAGRNDEWDDAIDAFPRREDRGEGTDRWLRGGDPEIAFERREFLERHPWRVFRAGCQERIDRRDTRWRLNWTVGLSGLGLAASLAALLVVSTMSRQAVDRADDGIRTKGVGQVGPIPSAPVRLAVVADGVEVADGGRVAPGAELVFRVDSGDYDHVVVFGVEDGGRITPYYPDVDGGISLLVGRGSGLRLPDSVILDDTVGRERFVAVFSLRPLGWGEVEAAAARAWQASGGRLEQMGRLGLADTEETSVWFEKAP